MMDCDNCSKYTLDKKGFRCPNCRTNEDPFEWDVWFYFVYVIELNDEVKGSRKFRERNPKMKEDAKCFYVGQTARCPDIRFKQHQTAYRKRYPDMDDSHPGFRLYNKYAYEHGLWLRRKMYKRYNPIFSKEESKKMEARVANVLRNKGYGVWYN